MKSTTLVLSGEGGFIFEQTHRGFVQAKKKKKQKKRSVFAWGVRLHISKERKKEKKITKKILNLVVQTFPRKKINK